MSLNRVDSVHDILRLVAEVSGKPVEFVERESLPTYAGIRMARRDMPARQPVYAYNWIDEIFRAKKKVSKFGKCQGFGDFEGRFGNLFG